VASLNAIFVKNILARLGHRTFHEMDLIFSVNILRDINVCLIALVYVDCLVFV
jgi:hypothetical protein